MSPFCLSASLLILLVLIAQISSDIHYEYQGCYKATDDISYINLGQALGVNECLVQALFARQFAFGLRTSNEASKQHCYYGSLSAMSTSGNFSITNCDAFCPNDHYYPCGKKTGDASYFALHTISCNDSNWSSWSGCSQTCDSGIKNRYKTVYNSSTCYSSLLYEYRSCDSGISCHGTSSKTEKLKTISKSKSDNHPCSTSSFADKSKNERCKSDKAIGSQEAVSTTLQARDSAMRPGSELLSPSEEQTLVALQYTSAGMIWIEDGQKHPLWDSINSTIEGDCFALFSRKNSSEKERKETGLESPDCKRSLDCPLCVKRDHIYSSYEAHYGMRMIEKRSSEEVTTEFDAHACGARCSRLIGCLGFSYNSRDQSCIPTKVSLRTPMVLDGSQIYTTEEDENWTFYDRI